MQGIWQDIEVSLSDYLASGKVDYTIKDVNEAETIYTGRAYEDEDGYCVIRINDILKDYLAQKLIAFASSHSYEEYGGLALEWAVEVNGDTVETDEVAFDYSYETFVTTPTFPITGLLDSRLPLVFTSRSAGIELEFEGASASSYAFGNTGPANCRLYTPALTGLTKITLMESPYTEWRVAETCNRYALYYVNAAGGWDILVLEGACRLVESYERTTFGRDYLNTGARNAGTIVLRNDLTRKWSLQTGWIRESQSRLLHHLLGSCLVYLCDMEDNNKLTPVIIKTSEVDVRMHGQGAAAAKQFTIEVEEARERVRR